MKPFRFPLQPLRSLREHKEESVRERYAHTLRVSEEAAARAHAAAVELTACWTSLGQQLSTGVNSAELKHARAWCTQLETCLKERTASLQQARQAVNKVFQELVVATRERETLDRFYDKRRGAHDRESQRQDQKMLDEMAIQVSQIALPLRPAKLSFGPG
ncbi:MAG TPA: flagellar export protein FliJ [Clostridia bacterium]|nr:flagellar export protein FliJ [Clostridia bacterium]